MSGWSDDQLEAGADELLDNEIVDELYEGNIENITELVEEILDAVFPWGPKSSEPPRWLKLRWWLQGLFS